MPFLRRRPHVLVMVHAIRTERERRLQRRLEGLRLAGIKCTVITWDRGRSVIDLAAVGPVGEIESINLVASIRLAKIGLRPVARAPSCTTSSCSRARAASSAAARARSAQVLAKEGDHANIKLPSGEVRQVKLECMATIGQVGNLDHENVSIGKAGRVRWKGFRPTVRGTVMNPVDHPMGGGEGKGKGNHPMTPWGKPTKGYKTRRGARPSDRYIVTRRTK